MSIEQEGTVWRVLAGVGGRPIRFSSSTSVSPLGGLRSVI